MSDPPPVHQLTEDSRAFWNNEAATFDNAPDHGLRDRVIRDAWTALLKQLLPPVPSTILDIGCGTGSLSVVMTELGHIVTGVDFAPQMIASAKSKAQAADLSIEFLLMDAAVPEFPAQSFNVIVCRHLLWALPEPAHVLRRWGNLLTPGGSLHLIEGNWHTGGGLPAQEIVVMMPDYMTGIEVQNLSKQVDLWGSIVLDDRYVISAQRVS